MFGTRRLLCPGMRGASFQLSVALGNMTLSDAPPPSLLYAMISLEHLSTLMLASQGTRQWRPSLGRRRSLPRQRQPSRPSPPLDLSSGRPARCARTGRFATLWQAPVFRLHPLSGVFTSSRWRTMPLVPRSFLSPLGATSRRLACRRYRLNKTVPSRPRKGSQCRRA